VFPLPRESSYLTTSVRFEELSVYVIIESIAAYVGLLLWDR